MQDIKMSSLPILDLSYLSEKSHSLDCWKGFSDDVEVKRLADEICDGFQTWGFLYITGHGIRDEVVQRAFRESRKFFAFPAEKKKEYARGKGICVGYVPPTRETFSKEQPADLKECFDYLPTSRLGERLSAEFPHFVDAGNDLFSQCHVLVLNLLRLLSLALNIDSEQFVRLHNKIGDRQENGTSMRMLYYPSLLDRQEEDKTMRCSEHTDYGTVTLLFQDNVGGLEVKSPSGVFVKVQPIPGAIVINGGDLLQKWSGERFAATLHRVSFQQQKTNRERQSIAFFAHPDYATRIQYTDAQGETKQANAYEHLKQRFDATIAFNDHFLK